MFALGVIVARGQSRGYGGFARLLASALIEALHSMLLAPVRMLFHTQFVIAALTGWKLEWKSPPRHDAATGWHEAWRRHGVHTLLGVLWISAILASGAVFPWWLSPILAGLLVGVPISVWSSRASLGRWLRRAGLFSIPEEREVPAVLANARRYARDAGLPHRVGKTIGFGALAAEPALLETVAAACSPRAPVRGLKAAAQQRRVESAASGSAAAVPAADQLRLLASAQALREFAARYGVPKGGPTSLAPGLMPRLANQPRFISSA